MRTKFDSISPPEEGRNDNDQELSFLVVPFVNVTFTILWQNCSRTFELFGLLIIVKLFIHLTNI
jgi:hypothetical protein